jgi:hypothetical protein
LERAILNQAPELAPTGPRPIAYRHPRPGRSARRSRSLTAANL